MLLRASVAVCNLASRAQGSHSVVQRLCGQLGASVSRSCAAQASFSTQGLGTPPAGLSGDDAGEQGVVALLSGGVESAVMLCYWKHWDHGQQLYPLFVNYGQKAWAQELLAARALCQHLSLPLQVFDLSALGGAFRQLQAPLRQHVPLPHRNLLLLSVASSYAAQTGASHVALAMNSDDLSAYSSASDRFLTAAAGTLQELEPPTRLLTPLLGLTKARVVALGQSVGVPWQHTFSCMTGFAGLGTSEERAAAAAAAVDAATDAALEDLETQQGGGQAHSSGSGEQGSSSGSGGCSAVQVVEQQLMHCGRCSQCRARRAAFLEAEADAHDVQYATG